MKMIQVKKFCAEGVLLQGQITVSDLPRLMAEEAASSSGIVEYHLQGAVDQDARPYIKGQLSVELSRRCQRCLESAVFPIQTQFQWSPVDHEDEAKDLPESYDPILVSAAGEVLLTTLLEDEILLSLPLISSHPEGVCGIPASLHIGSNEAEPLEVEKNNPFAMLENLKNKVQ